MKPKNSQFLSSEYEDFIDQTETVASATECTGLIPTPPLSEPEAESYLDLYDIPKSVNQKKGTNKK